jgi:hypothetical protein
VPPVTTFTAVLRSTSFKSLSMHSRRIRNFRLRKKMLIQFHFSRMNFSSMESCWTAQS